MREQRLRTLRSRQLRPPLHSISSSNEIRARRPPLRWEIEWSLNRVTLDVRWSIEPRAEGRGHLSDGADFHIKPLAGREPARPLAAARAARLRRDERAALAGPLRRYRRAPYPPVRSRAARP